MTEARGCIRVAGCRRHCALRTAKVIAAHGSPIPFLRRGSRDELREATGDTKLPALKLPDGTMITYSRAILSWISEQSPQRGGSSGPSRKS